MLSFKFSPTREKDGWPGGNFLTSLKRATYFDTLTQGRRQFSSTVRPYASIGKSGVNPRLYNWTRERPSLSFVRPFPSLKGAKTPLNNLVPSTLWRQPADLLALRFEAQGADHLT